MEFNHLPAILAALPHLLDAHINATADAIAQDAAQRAPERTGDLAQSIAVEQDPDGSTDVVVGVDYGPYVEYGTSKMRAEPFLTPAVDAAWTAFASPEIEGALAEVK